LALIVPFLICLLVIKLAAPAVAADATTTPMTKVTIMPVVPVNHFRTTTSRGWFRSTTQR
jgi:hypothetical protein